MINMKDFNDALKDIFASFGVALADFVETLKKLASLYDEAEKSQPPQKYKAKQRKDALFRRPVTKIYKANLIHIKKHQPYSRRIF